MSDLPAERRQLLNHPLIEPYVAGTIGNLQPVTLEWVLGQLGRYGEVCLIGAPEARPDDRDEPRYHCALIDADRWTTVQLLGTGEDAMTAALRCLLEVLSEMRRQTDATVEAFGKF